MHKLLLVGLILILGCSQTIKTDVGKSEITETNKTRDARITELSKQLDKENPNVCLDTGDQSTWSKAVNGLRLRLGVDKKAHQIGDKLPIMIIELRNIADTKRMVPASYFIETNWWNVVSMTVRSNSGKYDLPAGLYSDRFFSTYLVPRPLTIKAGECLQTRVDLKIAKQNANYFPTLDRLRKDLNIPGTITISTYIEVIEATRRSYYPHWSCPKRIPEDFPEGWPEWAWRGKLVSNTITIEIKE